MTFFEVVKFLLSPIIRLLDAYARQASDILTSRVLRRRAVQSMVAVMVLVLMMGVSLCAYLGFYWNYMPSRGHVGKVHLQYTNNQLDGSSANAVVAAGPTAIVDFSRGGRYHQFLRGEQAYDIFVKLSVPTSQTNVALGNFMVKVQLLNSQGGTVISSSRPAIVMYESTLLRLLRTVWRAIPLILRWAREAQTIRMPMIENFVENSGNPVSRALVEISNPRLQIYKASIHIEAHFHGLRYFMYYHWILTALVFMSIFTFWEIMFCVLTWQVLSGSLGTDAQALTVAHRGSQQYRDHQFRDQTRAPTAYLELPSSTSAPSARLQPIRETPQQAQLQDRWKLLSSVIMDDDFDEDDDDDGDNKEEAEEEDEVDEKGGSKPSFNERSFTDDAVVPETTIRGQRIGSDIISREPGIGSGDRLPPSLYPRLSEFDDWENVDDGSGTIFGEAILQERLGSNDLHMQSVRSRRAGLESGGENDYATRRRTVVASDSESAAQEDDAIGYSSSRVGP